MSVTKNPPDVNPDSHLSVSSGHDAFIDACQVVLDRLDILMATTARKGKAWHGYNRIRAGIIRHMLTAEESMEPVAWRPADNGAPGVVVVLRSGLEVCLDRSPDDMAESGLDRLGF